MIELRPKWCIDESLIDGCIKLGAWLDESGRDASHRTGDDWSPGEGLRLQRDVSLLVTRTDLRRQFNLPAGATVGIAARWMCRSTATAGVHDGGPGPIPLDGELKLSLTVPSTIAGSLDLETCLVVSWRDGIGSAGHCPNGGLIWSDGWASAERRFAVVLEGSEFRVPVQTLSFKEHFGETSSSVWAIEIDSDIELEDIMANVVTVLLNRDVLARDFKNQHGEPDAGALPPMAQAGINSDLLRLLTGRLAEELKGNLHGTTYPEGTMGQILTVNLDAAFGSVAAALQCAEEDEARFARLMWSHCAPDSWNVRR